jgi:transcriptional regulator with XRE-family HTH domain
MAQSLHEANFCASPELYTGQFAFSAGLWQNVRMKLRLKMLRKERHLTIDQLADISGISRAHISLLENGRRQPSSDALQSLASSLKVRVTELIDEGAVGDDLATLINIMGALSSEDRAAILRDAAARLPKRRS